jgi:hypothetical protein
MVSMLASSVVDRGFVARSDQSKDYSIGICLFSAKHETLKRKSKNWIMCPSGVTCLSANSCFSELVI